MNKVRETWENGVLGVLWTATDNKQKDWDTEFGNVCVRALTHVSTFGPGGRVLFVIWHLGQWMLNILQLRGTDYTENCRAPSIYVLPPRNWPKRRTDLRNPHFCAWQFCSESLRQQ